MMEEKHSPNHFEIIGQLAREYEEKYKELEKLVSEIPPEHVFSQLNALAERTTDRFRSAQAALFSMHGLSDGEGGEAAMTAITALCRAFDEMRIFSSFWRRTEL